jgi:O-antigen/teichoic acid export membrane protein
VTLEPPSSLGRRIAVGAGWMIAAVSPDRGIGLVSIAILARLLVPQDFGLVALAVSFIAVVSAFAQLGWRSR